MNRQPNTLKLPAAFLTCLALLLGGVPARADARSEYLINMLETAGSYRVRVQAATTLGKIRCLDALPALGRALVDENELVVISAAVALGQLAEPTTIPAIEKALAVDQTPLARAQLESTLRVLKSLTEEGDTADADAATARWLILVDKMGNSSGKDRDDVTDLLREIVIKKLRRQPGVVLQEPGLKPKKVKQKLKSENLAGYILSGSVVRMEQVGAQMVVKISLNVFTNPEYNLLMMPSAEGAVPVIDGPLARETELAAQDKAIRAVAEALVDSVFKALEDPDSL